jgi:hypothetical protein
VPALGGIEATVFKIETTETVQRDRGPADRLAGCGGMSLVWDTDGPAGAPTRLKIERYQRILTEEDSPGRA